jgi:hypothetical protein
MWFLVQNYSTVNTYAGVREFAGSYLIVAQVRTIGTSADIDVQTTLDFEVLEQPPVSTVGISADTVSPATIQSVVTFTAVASGGSNNVEYLFWMQAPNGIWTLEHVRSDSFDCRPVYDCRLCTKRWR